MLLALNFENIGGSYRWALFLQTIVSFSKCQKLRKLDRYVAGLKLGKPMGYVSGLKFGKSLRISAWTENLAFLKCLGGQRDQLL